MSDLQRRQHERCAAALAVAFTRDGVRVTARSKDISLGGMFVETDGALPSGTKLAIEVALPALTHPVSIDATVQWAAPHGMGIQWGVLRTRDTWAISQLVAKKR